ncbi:MAG: hypothetical protein IPH68_05120 [Chitinophagaceae bacterium]|nr:hypothetical protein [Chitinophagaceae bacterium]
MKFLLLIVLSFSVSMVQAQNSNLTGKIVNQKNEPVASVSVKIDGFASTSTDIDGRYNLTLVTGQKYTITCFSDRLRV